MRRASKVTAEQCKKAGVQYLHQRILYTRRRQRALQKLIDEKTNSIKSIKRWDTIVQGIMAASEALLVLATSAAVGRILSSAVSRARFVMYAADGTVDIAASARYLRTVQAFARFLGATFVGGVSAVGRLQFTSTKARNVFLSMIGSALHAKKVRLALIALRTFHTGIIKGCDSYFKQIRTQKLLDARIAAETQARGLSWQMKLSGWDEVLKKEIYAFAYYTLEKKYVDRIHQLECDMFHAWYYCDLRQLKQVQRRHSRNVQHGPRRPR